jgi:hypothetical protein
MFIPHSAITIGLAGTAVIALVLAFQDARHLLNPSEQRAS